MLDAPLFFGWVFFFSFPVRIYKLFTVLLSVFVVVARDSHAFVNNSS